MCCALIALCMAIATAGRAGLNRIPVRQLRMAAFAGTAIAIIAGSAFAAEHVRHYFSRAAQHERSVLAEILAQPICSGSAADNTKAVRLSFAAPENATGR
jgi:hypothetical protein